VVSNVNHDALLPANWGEGVREYKITVLVTPKASTIITAKPNLDSRRIQINYMHLL
jgi:hypothetical protein